MRSHGKADQRGRFYRRGISLLESMMLMTILAIVSGSAGKVLMAITKIPGQTDTTLRDETALVSKMEQMRSVSFDNLTLGTGVSPYSDGGVYVDIAYADPSGGSTDSSNWKKITIRNASGRQLVLMVCKP